MKTNFLFVLSCVAVIAVACEREPLTLPAKDSDCEIILDLKVPGAMITKASSGTYSAAYESSVNSVQILVFSKTDGMLDNYFNAGKTIENISLKVSKGEKQVWAVINGPDVKGINSLSSLKSKSVSLGSDNGTSETKGMVMAGSRDVSLSASETSVSLEVKRFVSRVTLVKITNSLPVAYGDLKIKSAVLTNVVGNQNIEGSAQASEWYNKFGRADENPQVRAHVIDGSVYRASFPDLTFRSIDKAVTNGTSLEPGSPFCFYSMPNPSTVAPSAFSGQFEAQRTMLVVTAELGGQKYYYPVVLDGAVLERNKTYSVSLNILGPGSGDPNEPVVKSDCAVSITVQDWQQGTEYNVGI